MRVVEVEDPPRNTAISVVGTKDADHCHTTIENCTIFNGGVDPLVEATKRLDDTTKRLDDTIFAVGMTACFLFVLFFIALI